MLPSKSQRPFSARNLSATLKLWNVGFEYNGGNYLKSLGLHFRNVGLQHRIGNSLVYEYQCGRYRVLTYEDIISCWHHSCTVRKWRKNPVELNNKHVNAVHYYRYCSNNHLFLLSKSCFYHIRSFRQIRSSMDHSAAVSVALALVSSRLDYVNSILSGSLLKHIARIQRAQHALTRVIFATAFSCPISPTNATAPLAPYRVANQV